VRERKESPLSTTRKKIDITPDNTTTITDVMMVSLRVGQVTLLASFFTSVKKVVILFIIYVLSKNFSSFAATNQNWQRDLS
jgi:hypothetical protein